ncbi:hypothetical protein N431DRAFT_493581 [Stipitochalara longipes BDJ]|nr:hypothetical protein N431DRAFT_493581 [Stipitochalara longipes BDJ]
MASDLVTLCQIITPVGMLGYGFDEALVRKALQDLHGSPAPTALILDSGSTDGGPLKLAVGSTTVPRSAYERDIGKLLALSHEFHVNIIISSAGGDGSDAHVDEFLDVIEEIVGNAKNRGYRFKTLAIYSNVSKSRVLESLATGVVKGCGTSVPALTTTDVHNAGTIVAQIGHEPFLDAMVAQPDFNVIIGGRAYDPSPYIAYCVDQTFRRFSLPLQVLTSEQLGGFAFMGKIMECGALCGMPKSASSMATVYCDGTFDIVPLSPESNCSPASITAHTLYEKTRPDILPGPGGVLDLNSSQYDQLSDGRSVRVRGAHFFKSRRQDLPYTVKLEAAKTIGFRTMIMGGIRDPILIGQFDSFLVRVKEFVKQQHEGITEAWDIDFHVYGANGIIDSLEPGSTSYTPREIFLVGEALAASQRLATSIASCARIACVHGPYPGQRGTEMGSCADFCIYHLIPLKDGEESATRILEDNHENSDGWTRKDPSLFSWKMVEFGTAESSDLNVHQRLVPEAAKATLPDTHGLESPPAPPTYLNLSNPLTLKDIAPIIRSKNSGPYETTLDVISSHVSIYALVKDSKLLNAATIARLYHLREDEIIYCGFYDQAMAFKATMPRKRNGKVAPSGGFMETDVHGSHEDINEGILKLNI